MTGINRLKQLKFVIFDVDGVFTDGRTWQDAEGCWRRYFSVRDTMGIRALRRQGIKVAVITSITTAEVRAHMAFVGVDEFRDGVDKIESVNALLNEYGLDESEIGFVTADRNDAPLFETLGFTATVVGASNELQRAARFVTSRAGGDGAVLEICNLILQHIQPIEASIPRPRAASL